MDIRGTEMRVLENNEFLEVSGGGDLLSLYELGRKVGTWIRRKTGGSYFGTNYRTDQLSGVGGR